MHIYVRFTYLIWNVVAVVCYVLFCDISLLCVAVFLCTVLFIVLVLYCVCL
jgi:hypothetical protein